jgi:hypothetical protein
MAKPQEADPVKLFTAILWADEDALQKAVKMMEENWGAVDFVGPDHSFDSTHYYEPEMGANLKRRLISFLDLFPPDNIGSAKHRCNELEDLLAKNTQRLINLDIGYLDHNKIVLASFKGAGQKIYMGKGVWADLIARYRSGRYQPFEWTFPDFKDGRYDRELNKMREIYRKQISDIRSRGI